MKGKMGFLLAVSACASRCLWECLPTERGLAFQEGMAALLTGDYGNI